MVTPPANEKWTGLSYVFVTKLNPSGSELIYSAMIGGTRGVPTLTDRGPQYNLENRGADIAVDAVGNAYVVGSTYSRNFPTTPGAITVVYNADLGTNEYGPKGAGFALKLNATGSALEYSTLLLAALPRGVVVDAGGNAYITGSGGQGFPTTPGAFQQYQRRDPGIDFPASDAIVAKLNPTGTGFIFSTFIGGGSSDIGWDIALDAAGSAYITGYTAKSVVNNGAVITSAFPETRAAFKNFEGPNYVYVFAAKFSATGALGYSVLLGGAGILDYSDYGPDVAVDSTGNAYIAGFTRSTKFPVTPGAYQTAFRTNAANDNGFVTKLNATGTDLVYSTYFGGSNRTQIYDVGVNAAGQAQIIGKNMSAGFPTANDPRQCFFVAELSAAGNQLLSYSPFDLGEYSPSTPRSIVVDAAGSIYVTGNADITLLTTPGAYRTTFTNQDPYRTSPFVLKLIAPQPVLNVSAASYAGGSLASDSIIAAFGSNLSTNIQAALSNPLPTSLGGTTVKVRDSAGVERLAPLFFVSPTQINYLVPTGTANGAATITVNSGSGAVSSTTTQVAYVAPGLFTADASGRGVSAAVVLRVRANGTQVYEPVAQYDAAQNKVVAVPIDLGPEGDQVFLITYGTGIRYNTGLSGMNAKLGGMDAPVLFAGAQGDFFGLDQVNVRLPRSLAGRGDVDLVLAADGKQANTVQVRIK
ncbi:MAG: SBBP repeat-containing protein [Acidobacteriota bacterium]